MRVLIIKTSSMGDVIHTLPSLTDAINFIPTICFDWIVEEDFLQIPSWHKAVNRVIPVAIRRWRKTWFSKPVRIERKTFKRELRSQYYDVIIDAQGLLKSAFLVAQIVSGVKHGFDWKTSREPLSSLFYKYHHYVEKQQHAIERTRELFAKSLGYIKPKTQIDYGISWRFTNKIPKNNIPYILLSHATTRDNKHWPEFRWRKLIALMQSHDIYVKLLWNTEYDRQKSERLAVDFTNVEILPKLSLTQVAVEFKRARAIVSVDTGLSHLAAALDRPNFILFGPTDPNLVGAYGKNQHQIISTTKKMIDINEYIVFNHICKILFWKK